MLPPRLAHYFLVLCWALGAVAYTPCSYDGWVQEYQSCMQPCYGEQYYDRIFNTAKCGNYSAGGSSTKRSHVKCLCETASITLNVTKENEACISKHCDTNTTSYNTTHWLDTTVDFGYMCQWALGEKSKCSIATSVFPGQLLAGLVLIIGFLLY